MVSTALVRPGPLTTTDQRLHLPARERLSRTAEDDPLLFYYMPIIGRVYRRRLELAVGLLESTVGSAVEVGYGSGILLVELGRRADRLIGVDRHDAGPTVRTMARAEGFDPLLVRGGICELPLAAGSADLLVCLSVLEHVRALDRAAAEIARVLRPGGVAVLGYPRVDRLMQALFPLIGFRGIAQHHVSTPADIERAVGARLTLETRRTWPRGPLPFYTVTRWRSARHPG